MKGMEVEVSFKGNTKDVEKKASSLNGKLKNIASTGGIRSEILNMDEICVHILNVLYEGYKDLLKDKYNITNNDVMEMYEIIAKKIGAFKNGEIDYERVSQRVYNDVISGNIKGVTFDLWK